jgi:hypothetical protein
MSQCALQSVTKSMNELPVEWIFLNIFLIKKWSLQLDLSYLK